MEQMELLLALLKSNSVSGIPSVSVAHTSNELYALSCRFKSTPWIIDSGASDHMNNSSNIFESYSPCARNKNVRIADFFFLSIKSILTKKYTGRIQERPQRAKQKEKGSDKRKRQTNQPKKTTPRHSHRT